MKPLRLLVTVALLAMPVLTSVAKADNVSASQLSAAGHGRRAIMSNRPSREIYHRQGYSRPMGYRHHRRSHY